MRTAFFLLTIFVILVGVEACLKDKGIPAGYLNDEEFYQLCKDTAGHRFYQNDSAVLSPAGNSPHGFFRVRFNPTAWNALDSATGKLPPGSQFPDRSLLVKEVHSTGAPSLNLYAAMYKQEGAWIWAEYKTDGNVAYSLLNGGTGCISCHSEGGNVDKVRLFALH